MIGETILSTMSIIATLALIGILIYSIIYFYKEKEYWMSAFFACILIILAICYVGSLLASLGI